MSLIDSIKSFFGMKPVAKAVVQGQMAKRKSEALPPFEEGPLGLAIGRMLKLDDIMLEGLKDQLSMFIPEEAEQQICAYGKIDLGGGSFLHRYYLDDDCTWLQVVAYGQGATAAIEAIGLFAYESAPLTNNPSEIERFIGRSSDVGLPEIKRHEKTYLREWGTEEGQTDLVPYEESVENSNRDKYVVAHKAMLYTRELNDSERAELLIFALEESLEDPGEATMSTSYGISLIKSDIKVI